MYIARVIIDGRIVFTHEAETWDSAWNDLSEFLDLIFCEDDDGHASLTYRDNRSTFTYDVIQDGAQEFLEV